jgi:hypothetical protein
MSHNLEKISGYKTVLHSYYLSYSLVKWTSYGFLPFDLWFALIFHQTGHMYR